jgi:hypothetical protein
MDLIDCLHGIQMVDTRVKAYFVHDNDASGFCTLLQRPNCRRNVACRDDMRVAFDSCFNNQGMERVGNKRDNCIYGNDRIIERRSISNIKRDGRRARKALR